MLIKRKTLITTIARLIKTGEDDSTVDVAIDDFLNAGSDTAIILKWRVDHYPQLRRWAYPPIEDFIDAKVKIAQGGSLSPEGDSQLNTYTAACCAVKLRFPKL